MIKAVMASRWTVGAAALVAAALLAGLVATSTGAHAQEEGAIPGGIYTGSIEDTSGVCSEGALTLGVDISMVVGGDGAAITQVRVADVTLEGLLPQPMDVSLNVNIPIAEDGSFDHDFDPAPDVSAHVQGMFEGETVSGSLRVEVFGAVECEGTFTAQLSSRPVAGEILYVGQIEVLDGSCGGGTITVGKSADGMSVTSVSVDGFNASGTPASGFAAFDEGAIRIAEDGSFGDAYFPGHEEGQEIFVTGTFSGSELSGTVTVSPSTCGVVPFSANLLLELGRGGSGPAAGSGGGTALWMVLAAGLGAFGLATTGLAVMRRRSA